MLISVSPAGFKKGGGGGKRMAMRAQAQGSGSTGQGREMTDLNSRIRGEDNIVRGQLLQITNAIVAVVNKA